MTILLYIISPSAWLNPGSWLVSAIQQQFLHDWSGSTLTNGEFVIARIKYDGGGDWYSDPSSIPNLLKFIGGHTLIKPIGKEARVRLKDDDLFSYPYLYITGHGDIIFDDKEIKRLRLYLESGGFIHADDNYGMDKSFRREIR